MNKINDNTSKIENYKLYTTFSIGLASYIGGPIAGCYLMSTNFKNLQKPQPAKKTLAAGIFATLIIFGALPFIPEKIINKIPDLFIPLVYTSIIVGYAQQLQGKEIKTHLKNGKKRYSNWKVCAIGILCLLITLIYFFVIITIFPENTLK